MSRAGDRIGPGKVIRANASDQQTSIAADDGFEGGTIEAELGRARRRPRLCNQTNTGVHGLWVRDRNLDRSDEELRFVIRRGPAVAGDEDEDVVDVFSVDDGGVCAGIVEARVGYPAGVEGEIGRAQTGITVAIRHVDPGYRRGGDRVGTRWV